LHEYIWIILCKKGKKKKKGTSLLKIRREIVHQKFIN